jgi:hypothetical protein
VEVVRGQDVEDYPKVLKVFGPGRALDPNIIEEDEHAPTQEWLHDKVH